MRKRRIKALSFALGLVFLIFSCSMEDEGVRYMLLQSEEQMEQADSSKETLAADENESKTSKEEINSQTETVLEDDEKSEEPPIPALWTFLVYMAADNELESSAIDDINEMENVDFNADVNLLVLFDRSPGYDSSNGDWTGTRLYKISKDETLNQNLITSERLSADELGLSKESESELDMGNKSTLSGFLQFARRNFPSDNLALIVWGHGAGWRGFSEDETNDSRLSLSNLRAGIEEGLSGEKLEFLGFDTCFSATLEVAYELKNCAKIMAGTPGIVDESGWNYKSLFSDFLSGNFSLEELSRLVQGQFESSYESYKYGAFCVLNLKETDNLFSAFNDFSSKSASKITSLELRNKIFSTVEKSAVSYQAASSPTDFYVDILSLEKNICEILSDDEVSLAGQNLERNLNSALASSWNVNGGCSLSVYFGYYKTSGIFSLSHPELYINGSRSSDVCKFVSDCSGYAPAIDRTESLLGKLFYADF